MRDIGERKRAEASVRESGERLQLAVEAGRMGTWDWDPLTGRPGTPHVKGHRATLVQVVMNLVSNATKFVAPDVTPCVRVRAESRDGCVRLWVEDNGIGIAPEHHERIFRVFERLDPATNYPGTGIGLAIVCKAMERMGGRVGVESELGRGSRFWIELPAGATFPAS